MGLREQQNRYHGRGQRAEDRAVSEDENDIHPSVGSFPAKAKHKEADNSAPPPRRALGRNSILGPPGRRADEGNFQSP